VRVPAVLLAVLCVALALPAWGQDALAPEARGAPVELALEETSGTTRTIGEARGRVIALFFEDREHTEDNRALKLTLHQYIADNHLEDRMRIYAVADVHAIPGVFRDVARAAIRAIAGEYGIQILLDWDGVLLAAPFRMSAAAANVALLDREGRIAWRHAGALGETETTDFFRALRRLLRE
jgi:predicted transcriptional regulator